ncbi:DUF3987 domain-containing protein [Burkholderia ubonensis]|uniref:DUF3987 domain-containing protein n=1 Tax=Burkholderia ubonensis TaxID=101571 RepID=UPI00075C7A56|nr:DUF3987 domain-containing protein [Burkholderia ubonensis]KVC72105.1 hypothetical protein WI75_03025 [Burkholderia ubonensis]
MFISEPMSDRMPTYSIVRARNGAVMNHFAPSRSSYPVGSFPGLLGTVARDLSASGGVAAEIVGTELITFASLLTQGIADVTWPNGQPISIGANGLVAAPSGSGKSLVYKNLVQPIEKYLALRMTENSDEHCDLLLEDATREALVQSLSEWPVAGLITEEAGMLKRLLKDAPTLVKLLDGSPLRSARISTGRVALFGQRLSMLLIEQPEIFEETKRLLGAGKGGVGLVNRFFVMLSKDFRAGNSPHSVRLSGDAAHAYDTRVRELLDALFEHVDQGNPARPTVKLSAEASQCLIDLDHQARRKCTPGSPWFFISEYILRHAERVLRLAGVFHVFECGVGGEIALDTLQRAEGLGDWYVESFARVFYEPPKPTQVEADANELGDALFQTYQMTGAWVFRQSEMRTQALNLGLTSTRFTRALAVLCQQGRTRVDSYRNVPWITLDRSRLPSGW